MNNCIKHLGRNMLYTLTRSRPMLSLNLLIHRLQTGNFIWNTSRVPFQQTPRLQTRATVASSAGPCRDAGLPRARHLLLAHLVWNPQNLMILYSCLETVNAITAKHLYL